MSLTVPAVTFDLWHTLVYLDPDREEDYMRQQFDCATEVLEGSPLLSDRAPASPLGSRAAFEIEYTHAVTAAGEGRSVTPADQLARAARRVGRAARPELYVDRLQELVARTPFQRAPDALETLGTLRDQGYAVGVISNTIGEPGRFLRPMLERFGFDRFVQSYTFSDEHAWTKPAPEIFESSLASLGSEASAAVHVGDGESDIEGARRAGLRGGILFTGLQQYGERYRALFAPTARKHPGAEFVVATLPEVIPIVERLLPQEGGDRSKTGN